jgi:hypothetical protein
VQRDTFVPCGCKRCHHIESPKTDHAGDSDQSAACPCPFGPVRACIMPAALDCITAMMHHQ